MLYILYILINRAVIHNTLKCTVHNKSSQVVPEVDLQMVGSMGLS